MPAGTATTRARPSPAAVSCSVAGSVWTIKVRAGSWCLKDSPKSPRTALPRNRRYCSQSGSSRPSSARSWRTSSSRASSGRSSRVGSPVRCSSPNTITDTPIRTPRLCTSRRATYPSMPSGLPGYRGAPRLCRGATSAGGVWGAISGPPTAIERDFRQSYRFVTARRPLEAIVDAVDVHLLVAEEPGRVVVDQAQELAVELLALVGVHLRARLRDEAVDFGIAVLRDGLARLEVRRHPVVRLQARQAPAIHEDVLGLVIEHRAHVAAPLADDLHVSLDAVLGELTGHRLRDVLVHRPAPVGRLQRQRQVRLAGGGQQLPGFLGVVLVERDRGLVAPHVGRHRRVDALAVAEEHAVEDALHVHRVVDRLAHAPVGQRPAFDLRDAEIDDAAARRLLGAYSAGRGERL